MDISDILGASKIVKSYGYTPMFEFDTVLNCTRLRVYVGIIPLSVPQTQIEFLLKPLKDMGWEIKNEFGGWYFVHPL